MCIFRSIQLYVYKQSGTKMAYVFTWGCSNAVPRPDPRNLGIGHNQIWGKTDKVDSKFSMIKEHVTLRRTFSKYRIVILTREEWGENWPNQLRKGHVWFTNEVCNQ